MYVPAARGASRVTAGPLHAGAVADTVMIGVTAGCGAADVHGSGPVLIGFARATCSPTGFHAGSAADSGCAGTAVAGGGGGPAPGCRQSIPRLTSGPVAGAAGTADPDGAGGTGGGFGRGGVATPGADGCA